MKSNPRPGGRPPKFNEPRRVVTVTLPERTLRQLAAIAPDLARAIVRAADLGVAGGPEPRPLVELVDVGGGTSVILVPPSRCLRQIPWLRLIEISPARFLLTIVPRTPIESLEVAILDLLESLPDGDDHERPILAALQQQLRTLRREQTIWKAELLFVGGDNARFRA